MRTKNLTPFLFAATPTSLRPPKPSATLHVRGAFRLAPGEPVLPLLALGAQGSLSGDEFSPDDDERRGALLRASDFADHKPNVDILVRAHCHTPSGKPLTECPVRFSVGPVSKLLRVVGPRKWERGIFSDSPSKPEPFTDLPIDYEHAFGGPDHAHNPSGKGVGTPDLPNIEGPSDVITSRSDRFLPRGFGPLSPFWPDRASKVGKEYGKSYREKRAPYYAEDFDWSHFNAAPVDQQTATMRGDEEMSFQNLHPRSALFSAKLPGVRIRTFLRDKSGHAREVKMRLDTVFADIQAETLYLSWRGVEEVGDSDLADVTSVLVASELLGDSSKSAAEYLTELETYEKDPIANDPRAPKREPPPDLPSGDADDPVWAELGPKVSGLPPTQQTALRAALAGALARKTPGADVQSALLNALRSPASNSAPPVIPVAAGQNAGVSLRGAASSVQDAVRRLKALLVSHPVDSNVTAALDALEKKPFAAPTASRSGAPSALRPDATVPSASSPRAEAEGLPPFFVEADPTLTDGEPGKDEPGPGADLHGRDLSECDLSGKDLSKANLRGANLTRVNLEGANLTAANLDYAVLYEAKLRGADLTRASLKVTQLSKACGVGAKFVETTLEGTSFQAADFSEADFSGATGKFAIFSKATLTGSRLANAKFEACLFEGTELTKANFSRASLARCRFLGCSAPGADFTFTSLGNTSFTESNLEGSTFAEASGKRSIWLRAKLARADFRYAVLPDAHFQEATAEEARFSGADLSRVRFYRTSLVRAELIQANLLEADLRKADLTSANLSSANLFSAQFLSATSTGAVFDNANLKRTLLEGGR